MISDPHEKNSLLIDKINNIAKERGNIDLLMRLDAIVELAAEDEKITALAAVRGRLAHQICSDLG